MDSRTEMLMKLEEQRIQHRDLHGLTEEESQEYTRLLIESIRERMNSSLISSSPLSDQ